ncbi:MAG: type I-C CRISPR-associated protein Cas8c/Csd1 [Syntrophaceae bacterium]|nr:type I-C CRISPR-associated protein Cas8c/Csd1 [Syntrophaceae bacterium]
MILQELHHLYERLAQNPEINISEPGFSKENISFIVRIDTDGKFDDIEDWRTEDLPVKIEVPKLDGKRAGKVLKPYFLWDNTKYVFGRELKNGKEINTKDNEKSFIEFNQKVIQKTGLKSKSTEAVLKFISDKKEKSRVYEHDYWKDMLNSFITFRVTGDVNRLVVDDMEVKAAWKKYLEIEDKEADQQICLVSGKISPVYPIHPTIKRGIGEKNDIPLVSFNIACSESYSRKSNFNAPVSRQIASKFTHALNYLVDNPDHNLLIADTKTLFWAESNDRFSDFFGKALAIRDDDVISEDLSSFLQSVRSGKMPEEIRDSSRFFVLGLAPNAARVSVRIWYADSVENIAQNIGLHFAQLHIVKQNDGNREFPSLWRLIRETATQHKTENIPPNITGPLMRSILSGSLYSNNILSILLSRMRVDQEYYQLNYYRASFIKAILNRNYNKELTMSLDTKRITVPYLLGRLFATLEKVQEEASGGNLNATIKDRYFASASTSPRAVFPRLLTLHQNHLKKLKSEKHGLAVTREKLVGEIIGHLPPDLPGSIKLEDQGEFAIGYYHQRQDFFMKKEEIVSE